MNNPERKISIVNFLLTISCLVPFTAITQTISSFSPASGAVASSVTITGTGFNATMANNAVYIGGVKAPVTAASITSLTVTVPSGAATYSPITVINTGTHVQAVSKNAFRTTFPLGGYTITTSTFSTNTTFTSVLNNNSGGIVRKNMSIADFDGDGKPDIASVAPTQVGILRNTNTAGTAISSGSFAAVYTLTTAGSSADIYTGDLNNDGLTDIVVGNGTNVSIFINQSTPGTLSFAAKQDFTVTGPIVKIADMDNDGRLDIISAASSSATTAYILLNTTTGGSGTLSFAAAFSVTGLGSANDFTIADMNADGKKDIISVNASSINVFINTSSAGSLSFNAAVNVTGSISGASYPVMSIAAADLDNDGDQDLVVGNNGTTTSVIFTNTYVSGSFVAANLTSSTITIGTNTSQFSNIIDIEDVDGDGKPDIIMENSNSSGLYIAQNNYTSGLLSGSSFGTQVQYGFAGYQSVLAVDLSGDKKPELIGTTYFSSSIVVYSNLNTLPVILESFSATAAEKENKLNWTVNNTGKSTIDLEKSANGINFGLLSSYAVNTNSVTAAFAYTDITPFAGTTYYRLKLIDQDKTFTYSKIIAVNSTAAGSRVLVFPNPSKAVFLISGESPTGNFTVKLFSFSGVLLKQVNNIAAATFQLDLTGFAAGSYLLEVMEKSKTSRLQLIKY